MKDKDVVFAGYIHRHPLDTSVHVRIQTTKKEYTPQEVRSMRFVREIIAVHTSPQP